MHAFADSAAPDAIKPPFDSKLVLDLYAEGDQIYLCVLESGIYRWQWQAPDAKLFDKSASLQVSYHGAGPSWKYKDGSGVTAEVIKKIDAPGSDAAPWLLLKAAKHNGNG